MIWTIRNAECHLRRIRPTATCAERNYVALLRDPLWNALFTRSDLCLSLNVANFEIFAEMYKINPICFAISLIGICILRVQYNLN